MRIKGFRCFQTRRVTVLTMTAVEASDEILLTAIARAVGGTEAGEISVTLADGRKMVWKFKGSRKGDDDGASAGTGL